MSLCSCLLLGYRKSLAKELDCLLRQSNVSFVLMHLNSLKKACSLTWDTHKYKEQGKERKESYIWIRFFEYNQIFREDRIFTVQAFAANAIQASVEGGGQLIFQQPLSSRLDTQGIYQFVITPTQGHIWVLSHTISLVHDVEDAKLPYRKGHGYQCVEGCVVGRGVSHSSVSDWFPTSYVVGREKSIGACHSLIW